MAGADERIRARGRREALAGLAGLVLALALGAALHAPALDFGFSGDDFQWWHTARRALDEPRLLLADAGGFYRPANTWSLALDHLLHGTRPRGYHATNLVLYLLCGALFWVLLGRFALGPGARGLLAALWLGSPYTLEPAVAVAIRFELLLLLAWLTLGLAWPGAGGRWSPGRRVAAAGAFLLMAASKESWVVVPGFALAFELALAGRSLAQAARRAALVAVGPLAYVAVYFRFLPGDKGGYYGAGLAGAAKIPHAWAAFSGLRLLHPLDIPFALPEVLATFLAAAAAFWGWRGRSGLAAVGFAFFLLPFLPVLPVGFLTSRYTTIPYLGFLAAVAGAIAAGLPPAATRSGRAARAGVAALGLLALAASVRLVAADLRDARRADAAHQALLRQARDRFAGPRPCGPIVAWRIERDNPLLALALEPEGLPKLYYPRHQDPESLIDWAALVSYVREPLGGPLYVEVPPERAPAGCFELVAHISGRFVRMAAAEASVAAAAAALRERGERVKVLVPAGSEAAGGRAVP